MRTKGLLFAAFFAAAFLLLQTGVFAADLDYSGPIDSFTGEAISENKLSPSENIVPVANGIYYDRSQRVYVHELGGASGMTVSASVSDGMIVSSEVTIITSQGLETRLYCNGEIVEDADLSQIEAPGRYLLEARVTSNQFERVLGFTIVGTNTSLISSYPMPAGFVIKSVDMAVKDENDDWVTAKPQWDRSTVSMREDGAYKVQYECAGTGVTYTLQTIVDHTPPKLALENVVNGLAKGPVNISDLEEGCKIAITLNGGKMNYKEELTLNGDYKILLQDPAGNLTSYEFTILVYFDSNSKLFFALVVLLIAGTAGYLYYERKRLRVR